MLRNGRGVGGGEEEAGEFLKGKRFYGRVCPRILGKRGQGILGDFQGESESKEVNLKPAR